MRSRTPNKMRKAADGTVSTKSSETFIINQVIITCDILLLRAFIRHFKY